jgi:hypothetical protein
MTALKYVLRMEFKMDKLKLEARINEFTNDIKSEKNEFFRSEYYGKSLGYLMALNDMNVITSLEMELYTEKLRTEYFSS